ncbi:MAG: hypothetical protein IJH57_01920 [Mogibacterium sp.]|nr:hypothetical protein [Mogibacterium sp.]
MYSKSIGKSKTGITSHITAIIATIVLLCGLFSSADVYAETQSVTFGIYNANNTITKVNSIDLGTLDLSRVNPNVESTYMIEKQVCIKGAKKSGLILWDTDMSGDIDCGRGGFSGGYEQTNINNGVPYLIAKVYFNASEMKAGTYNATLKISVRKEGSNGTYTPVDVSANSGALVSRDGVLSIPVRIKLTGTNSALTGKVGGLKASAGNDIVTLSWSSSDSDAKFIVYRREGDLTPNI